MRLIFCSDPLRPRHIDPSYAAEADAARRLGIPCSTIDFEALVEGRDDVVSKVETAGGEIGAFRGWMMPGSQYRRLYEALLDRGVRLVNDPAAYEECHYLPGWYPALAGCTPRSIWTDRPDISVEELRALLAPFGDRPVLVKDWVKSRKHEWREACHIPSASDTHSASTVVRRMVALQGGDLSVGLVFREFVPLETVGTDPRTGMPLGREYRIFFVDGRPPAIAPYWPGVDAVDPSLPIDRFTALAGCIASRFFTMDVARTTSGEWLVIELGDGQVAGLPDAVDPEALFAALRDML